MFWFLPLLSDNRQNRKIYILVLPSIYMVKDKKERELKNENKYDREVVEALIRGNEKGL